ncbi:hypothetical protein EGW08_002516 [Elysia chlorotica]|uniref:Uncharacterized protein n=1 Tax=Elysia chlorotica TaxID=188477 RepID=A0A3S1BJE5_ELYCH|nr:hypothetical protein EGW08_002516 [Elysia chlorotica]
MPSTAFLMPNDRFWGAEEALVVTEHRNYTVRDYQQFFEDIGFPAGWQMRLDTQDLIRDVARPGCGSTVCTGRACPPQARCASGRASSRTRSRRACRPEVEQTQPRTRCLPAWRSSRRSPSTTRCCRKPNTWRSCPTPAPAGTSCRSCWATSCDPGQR